MAKKLAKSHMWTKDQVKRIATVWENKNVEDIAEELGVNRKQVMYMVGQMRKAGFKLARKHKKSYLHVMLTDVLTELKTKKK